MATVAAAVIFVVGTLAFVLLYIRRATLNGEALQAREAELEAERDRRAVQEAFERVERAKREQEVKDEADTIADGGDAADAAKFVREQLARLRARGGPMSGR